MLGVVWLVLGLTGFACDCTLKGEQLFRAGCESYSLGVKLCKAKKIAEAQKHLLDAQLKLERAAACGHANAWYQRGLLLCNKSYLLYSKGPRRDQVLIAYQCIERAAELGSYQATLQMVSLYRKEFVKQALIMAREREDSEGLQLIAQRFHLRKVLLEAFCFELRRAKGEEVADRCLRRFQGIALSLQA